MCTEADPDGLSVGRLYFVRSLRSGQYNDGVLEFIPHAEGFVKSEKGDNIYYFNYTDHLGNIRVTYTDDGSGVPYIVEESNYYPFGLKHNGYNNVETSAKDWGNIVTGVSSLNYKYKYQGQERQDELGLNWDSFKWRNYDYAIGRFMSIDPLSEKYSYQSTYAFAENKVVSHIELEGLEGLHHTKVDKGGNRTHILEKNVVVLTRMTSSKYSDEKNARIKAENQDRVDSIKSELKQSYAGAKNTSGESVEFKFNVFGMEVSNPRTLGDDRRKVATENGLEGKPAFEGGPNEISPAVIISAQQTGQSQTKLFEAELSQTSDVGHEVGHEFMKGGQKEEENPPGTGGLMDDPPGIVLPFEVDKMLRDSIEANK